MKKDDLIRELIDFVEGKTEFDVFYDQYKTKKYDKLFDVDLRDKVGMYGRNGTAKEFLKKYNNKTAVSRYCFWHGVEAFLNCYGYDYSPTRKYYDKKHYYFVIQPSYVYIEDEGLLNKYINEAPKDLNKTEQKKWIKSRIKQDFKYDKTPPRWIQDPEWPIIDGKPLVFKSQTKARLDDERVFYTFYNPDTKEEIIVAQYF